MSGQYLAKNEFLGNGPGQIPMPAGQWDTLVSLGEMPKPDRSDGLYSRATVEAAKEKIGWFAMADAGAMQDFCKNAVGRHCKPQGSLFQESLARLKEAERLDQEKAEAAFNKKVDERIAQMKASGRL